MRGSILYTCDVCKKGREADSNHWWLLTIGEHCLIIMPWARATEEEIANADSHVCGRAHLIQRQEQILNKLTPAGVIEIGAEPIKAVTAAREEIFSSLVEPKEIEDQGQDVAEYAVLLSVILVIAIGVIHLIGVDASEIFSTIGSALQ